MRLSLTLAALAFAAASPAVAQSIKPGLWEVHNKTNNPQIDQAMAEMQKQIAAMPPAQRKQMEAMMAQQGVRMGQAGAAGGMVAQVCVTREMAERNEVPMQDGCRLTRQERSGSTTRIAYTCTEPPSSGEGEFTVNGPGAYSSRMVVRTVIDGRSQTSTMESKGKWLQADCGKIKPLPAAGKK